VSGVLRAWPIAINSVVAAFVLVGAVVAPLLAATGLTSAATAVYELYHLTCHQWAFRSFFLFGSQAVYARDVLEEAGFDPFTLVGQAGVGWKMGFCERDLAIYVGVLVFGMWYMRIRSVKPLGFLTYGLLCLPMAVDGFTQLYGLRESTWELRVVTGLLFGAASAWFVYPRFDTAVGHEYAADKAWAPLPPRG
jgi:uncharacterized membrane protein